MGELGLGQIPGACVPAAELDVVFDTGAGFPENILAVDGSEIR